MTEPHSNRREFLKTSSAVATTGAIASQLALSSSLYAGGADETIRVALIGCGGRGSGAAKQALSTEGPVQLVAMADAFEDRLTGSLNNLKNQKEIKDRIDVPQERRFVGFDAYKKILEMSELDLVILATPPGFRPIHFEAAVNAGKHVFMEKPVAVDAPGVRKVLQAAEKAKAQNLAVGVGLQRHHQNTYIETMKQIKDGAIGDITSMRAYWNGGGVWVRPRQPNQTEMEYQMRNWYYFNWLCGDHIVEQHIHNLDVINWLKDAYPVSAQGMGGREVRDGENFGEIFDHHAVEFEYADGSRMFSYCRHIRNCWNSVSEHCMGTKGSADISAARLFNPDGKLQWRYTGRKNNPYQTEHDDLFAAIRAGTAYNEAEYGALSTMTAIFGRMCTYSGQRITWDQALNSSVDLGPKQYAWDAEPPEPKVAVPGQTKVL